LFWNDKFEEIAVGLISCDVDKSWSRRNTDSWN